jgi:hypothetical protein
MFRRLERRIVAQRIGTGFAAAHNPAFPDARLTMLGAKSTLKERWRQVLSEAQRIGEKHLLTLEPGISENQTDEMAAKRLRLVVPQPLHATYRAAQRAWLMDVAGFIALARERQEGRADTANTTHAAD